MEESEIVKKGKELYKKLLPQLLPHYEGQYITIHIPTGEYWIESNLATALKKAGEKYKDALFYSVKIGEKVMVKF